MVTVFAFDRPVPLHEGAAGGATLTGRSSLAPGQSSAAGGAAIAGACRRRGQPAWSESLIDPSPSHPPPRDARHDDADMPEIVDYLVKTYGNEQQSSPRAARFPEV
ncbi:MAG: hypothetical protein NVS2B4_05550 [Ramlibacter sp.]